MVMADETTTRSAETPDGGGPRGVSFEVGSSLQTGTIAGHDGSWVSAFRHAGGNRAGDGGQRGIDLPAEGARRAGRAGELTLVCTRHALAKRPTAGGPKARRQASPGQRPGFWIDKNPALKGRDNVCRPFRAGCVVGRGSQGVALGWLVCAPLVLLSVKCAKCRTRSSYRASRRTDFAGSELIALPESLEAEPN